jgi:metal-responsive CopG/Arc/MetJ family transcriptional regulator
MEKIMIGIRLSKKEKKILDDYSAQEERSRNEIVRELIRSLEPKIKREGEAK